jgi:hypothetical protein
MESIIQVITQPFVEPESSTLTLYQQVAGQLMVALDAVAAIIPKLEEAEASHADQVLRNLNVPDAFCFTALTAAEQLPEIDAAQKLQSDKDRIRMQYVEAFRPVDDKLDLVSRRVKHALRANKSIVAGNALELYALVRIKAKKSGNPALAAHEAALKRDLAKKSLTKAERDERKAAKITALVEKELEKRIEQEVQKRLKEVKNA